MNLLSNVQYTQKKATHRQNCAVFKNEIVQLVNVVFVSFFFPHLLTTQFYAGEGKIASFRQLFRRYSEPTEEVYFPAVLDGENGKPEARKNRKKLSIGEKSMAIGWHKKKMFQQ